MPLIDLKTSLKSLKYGKDRPHGGSSNQPYIQSSIPDGDTSFTGGPDFILRGGVLAPIRAAKDVSRLTQMFFDLKSPNGSLFTAKQNVLSRTSVQTQASKDGGVAYAVGAVNQGVYLPSSTLTQAGVGFTGTHLNLLGIDPSSPMTGVTNTSISSLFSNDFTLGLKRYGDVVKENLNGYDPSKNRLYKLSIQNGFILNPIQEDKKEKSFFQKIGNFLNNYTLNSPGNGILMRYSGGPGSILGIGKTIIPFADQRTGTSNSDLNNSGFFSTSEFGYYNYGVFKNPHIVNLQGSRIFNGVGASFKYQSAFPEVFSQSNEDIIGNYFKDNNDSGPIQKFKNNVNESQRIQNRNGSLTYTQKQLNNQSFETLGKNIIQQDFRSTLILGSQNGNNVGDAASEIKNSKTSSIISLSPNYQTKNIENRLDLGNPGKKNKNILSYTSASSNDISTNYKLALDKITAGTIYSGVKAVYHGDDGNYAGNDLVKFNIGVIQNDISDNSNYVHFRAFIDSFSDSYNSDWDSYNYIGRGDKFYNYKGFDRIINLSFTIYAQSKAELIPMYKKLNYLASSLTPDYSKFGFMKGNLHKMTVGGYLFEQVGILNSITYDIPQETTWEIGINDVGLYDDTVKELPHMIKVSNFSFTPIQHFLPRVADPKNQKNTRYIALSTTVGDNNSNYE